MKLNPAAILLQDYLELTGYVPDLSDWKKDALISNPPRYFRLLRIEACLKALQIEVADFHHFQRGLWCQHDEEALVNKIMGILKEPFQLDYARYIGANDSFSGMITFRMLLDIRKAISGFASLKSGIFEMSGHYCTPVFMLDHLEQKIATEQKTVDEVLLLLLNPKEIEMFQEQLIHEFGFPDVDLDEIDGDWI